MIDIDMTRHAHLCAAEQLQIMIIMLYISGIVQSSLWS